MHSLHSLVFAVLVSHIPSDVTGVSVLVIKPIRDSGEDAALIFVPGASIRGEAYEATARAVQKSSNIRLWVVLTGNYTVNTPNPVELPAAMEKAYQSLQDAGMKGKNYFAAAHSLGGVFLAPYAKTSALKAIILLGAYLTHGNPLSEYPLPVMTLSGELDGQARITRIAETYNELQTEVEMNADILYRRPVINIKGSCHAQFASGPMPAEVRKYDLIPEINDTSAHEEMGRHIANFLVVSLNVGNVTSAKLNISEAYADSGNRFGPLLDVRDMDDPEDRSPPWSVIIQQEIAGDLDTNIAVFPSISSTNEAAFNSAEPSISKSGQYLQVSTYTYIRQPWNPVDVSTTPESPVEIDVKLMAYTAIEGALNKSITVGNITTCKQLNEMAVSTAMEYSTNDAKRRYQASKRPIILEDDINSDSDVQWWTRQSLKLEERDDGLHVQSFSIHNTQVNSSDSQIFYCKMLSPYRAMEWINVDSLRKHKPSLWPMLHLGK